MPDKPLDRDAAKVDTFRRALGHEIRSLRTLRKLSRPRLAELVDISPTTLGRIERDGPVDVGDTWRIASALGISFPDLVARAEETATRLYNNDLDELARIFKTVSDMTDPDLDEAQMSDEAVRIIRNARERARDRRSEMQQIDDQAARAEDTPDPKILKDPEALERWLNDEGAEGR